MGHNDSVCDLMADNGNMKRLLAEMLPDMEARVSGMREAWPGREVLTALHRNERFVREMHEFTDGFEVPNDLIRGASHEL